MAAFKNRASHEYRKAEDTAIKKELVAAGIPYIKLPHPYGGEVRTLYIGVLNGFVFYRAWRYWVCQGDMPLMNAKEIYEKYQHLAIRVEGHAANPDPAHYNHCPIHDAKAKAAVEEMQAKGMPYAEMLARLEAMECDPSWPRFVGTYHIDTEEGLKTLAQYIRENDVYSHNGEEGSYAASVFPQDRV